MKVCLFLLLFGLKFGICLCQTITIRDEQNGIKNGFSFVTYNVKNDTIKTKIKKNVTKIYYDSSSDFSLESKLNKDLKRLNSIPKNKDTLLLIPSISIQDHLSCSEQRIKEPIFMRQYNNGDIDASIDGINWFSIDKRLFQINVFRAEKINKAEQSKSMLLEIYEKDYRLK